MNSTQARKILNLEASATKDQIKTAYRRLAMKYHPDRGAGSNESKFKEIKEAFEFLEKNYVAPRTDKPTGDRAAGSPFYKDLHKKAGKDYTYYYDPEWLSKHNSKNNNPWSDDYDYADHDVEVFHDITITLKQAFEGASVDTIYGKIPVPAGIWHSEEFEDYKTGVQFEVNIEQEGFTVDWSQSKTKGKSSTSGDVRTTIKLSVLRLIMGGWVNFENFDGAMLKIYVPPGTSVDSTLRVKEKGYNQSMFTSQRGNLYIKIAGTVESIDKLDPATLEEFLKAATK